MSFRIESLWAYISADSEGEEGVIARQIGGLVYPMVAADETRVRQLRPIVQAIIFDTRAGGGVVPTVRLVRFDQRVDLELVNEGQRSS